MNRTTIQKTAYIIAAIATLFGAGGGIVGFVGLMSQMKGVGQIMPIAILPIAMGGGFLLLLAATFLYLARKPQPWGKLLCVAGVPWIGFSAVGRFISQAGAFHYSPLLLLPGIGGALLLVIGLALAIVDAGARKPVAG
jgi:hypothetical protein